MSDDEDEEEDEQEREEQKSEKEVAPSSYRMKVPKSASGNSTIGIFFIIISAVAALFGINIYYAIYGVIFGVMIFFLGFIKMNSPFENTLILRLGKFSRIAGQGLYIMYPFIESGWNLDMRVLTTEFTANNTLTKDNVPASVNAVLFWKVADTRKAVLNVQDFGYSILNVSMVALREAVSTNDLSEILTNRQKISQAVQLTVSQKAEEWGINLDNVEIRDIQIPANLQNAMSQKAQADKEREARIIFADSEFQVAKKFKEAAKEYASNPEALQLRGMNMMYEGLKTGNSTIVIVPSSAVENMGFGGIMGTVQAKGLAKKNPAIQSNEG